MRHEQARQILDDATLAVQTGRFEDALPLIEQVLALDPENYEAYVVRGIALAQSNQPEEATAAFRKSIEINPNITKTHYNLAVHLDGLGRTNEALTHARRALEIDPSHDNSQSLLRKLERDLGMAAAENVDFLAPAAEMEGNSPYERPENEPGYYREGYDSDPEVHSIPLVERMGSAWLLTGVILAALPLLLFAIEVSISGMRSATATSLSGATGGAIVLALTRTVLSFFALTWLIMDALDRRLNLIWIVPFVFCCCCSMGYLHGAITLIYILLGRKRT